MKYQDLVVVPIGVWKHLQRVMPADEYIQYFDQFYELQPLIEEAFDVGGAYAVDSHENLEQIHLSRKEFLNRELEL